RSSAVVLPVCCRGMNCGPSCAVGGWAVVVPPCRISACSPAGGCCGNCGSDLLAGGRALLAVEPGPAGIGWSAAGGCDGICGSDLLAGDGCSAFGGGGTDGCFTGLGGGT